MSAHPASSNASYPRHRGALANADAVGQSTYSRCNDHLRLYLRVHHDRIVAASFEARGCWAVVVTGSSGCQLLHGLTLMQARQLTAVALDQSLGGLPSPHRHALWMFLECLHRALTCLERTPSRCD